VPLECVTESASAERRDDGEHECDSPRRKTHRAVHAFFKLGTSPEAMHPLVLAHLSFGVLGVTMNGTTCSRPSKPAR
jgi:hypothetical protein